MKKTIILFAIIGSNLIVCAQSQRLQLYEEFTGENCGPCATTNGPLNTFLNMNESKIVSIKYQVNIPNASVHPLYDQTAAEADNRRIYYNVNTAPYASHDGNTPAHAGSITQAKVNTEAGVTSPFTINLTHQLSPNRDSIFVKAVVKASQITSGTGLKLRIAVIERDIYLATPPGNNGEKHFEGVMRKMLPSADGTSLPALWSLNDSVVVNEKWAISNYVYDKAQLAVVAFVQNDADKNVRQTAYSPPLFNLSIALPATDVKTLSLSSNTFFDINTTNTSTSAETFIYSLISVQPGGWSANFVVNGNTCSASASVSVSGGASMPVTINVSTGTTLGVGQYTIKTISQTYPSAIFRDITVFVMTNGIQDLIISNSGLKGSNGPETAAAWDSVYTNAFAASGITTSAAASSDLFLKFKQANLIAGVGIQNIYYNVGWSFPSFADEMVNELVAFMNAGGNLFISGQDIGWDTWDAAGSGTAVTKSFYTNYLNAVYYGDGSKTSTSLYSNANDLLYGTFSNSAIKNFYGNDGSGNPLLFPDSINSTGIGQVIAYYNNNTARKAAVRATDGTYKMVYFSVGMEQLTDVAVKNNILKTTHDWFAGIISGVKFDETILALGQSYPNPADGFAYIPLEGNKAESLIEVTDIAGRVVVTEKITNGNERFYLNTSELAPGLYFYRIRGNNIISQVKNIEVIH